MAGELGAFVVVEGLLFVLMVACLGYAAYCLGKGRGMVEIVVELGEYLEKEGRDALSGRVRRLASAIKAERS